MVTDNALVRWPAEPGTTPVVVLETRPDEPARILGVGARVSAPGGGTPVVNIGLIDGAGDVVPITGRVRYVGHDVSPEGVLRVTQHDPESGLRIVSVLSAKGGAIRSVIELVNDGAAAVRIGAASSLRTYLPRPEPANDIRDCRVFVPFNTWCQEFRWQEFRPEQVGFVDAGIRLPSPVTHSALTIAETGSRSTEHYLPMGAITDTSGGTAWLWSIESNAAWAYSVTDVGSGFVVEAGGPDHEHGEWSIELAPGEAWQSRAASLAVSDHGLDEAFGAMTTYRRAIRRPNADNVRLPVIFNDYMNCLVGDPTTDKLLPLIDAAASVGSEYFVIDAGWYSDDDGWWDTVGEWRESTRRFPGGLSAVLDRIRSRGMIPGLWVEPEVMGVRSPAIGSLPSEAFFQRGGRPIDVRGRHQLDFRHPAVIERMDGVVDRLIADYGVGYFKFDYNITAAHGSDMPASASLGAALMEHDRAYAAWVAGIFERHPDLVIENCSSGGLRADYDQLSRMSLLSTSDQQDALRYVPIAAAAPTAVTPEQGAVWAYPQPSYDAELGALCLVNAMLGRVHLSGRIDQMGAEQLAGVRTAIATYKGIRGSIARGLPRWPLGLPGWYDEWHALALVDGAHTLLSVWRRGGPDAVELALPWLAGSGVSVGVAFPQTLPAELEWEAERGVLTVRLPTAPAARLLRLSRAAG